MGSGSQGGGGDGVTQIKPPDFVGPLLTSLAGRVEQNPSAVREYFPGETVAGFTDRQLQGQQAQIGAANQFGNLFGSSIVPGFQNMMAAADPTNDPVVQRQLNAIQQRGQQNLQDSMGAIADRSIGAGQLGGDRRGIAEGLAASRTNDAVLNAQANLLGQARGQGLEAAARGLAFSPNLFSLGQAPGNVLGQIGAQEQGLNQMRINEDINRFNFGQAAPEAALDRDLQRALGLAGMGSTTTVNTQGSGTSGLAGALGGGLAGAGLGAMVPGFGAGAGTGLAGALGPAGIGLGALGALAGSGILF